MAPAPEGAVTEHGPPTRIDTERLVIRCWREADAPLLREAVDGSLEHLRSWLPWANQEPKSLEETRELLAGFEAAFRSGESFIYGILSRDESRVIGGSGLHRRIGEGGLEIGYWIRADMTGRGLATEAVRAITRVGLAVPGIERIQIRCDPRNAASRRIPEKLGYQLVEIRCADTVTPAGEPRDTVVYETRG